MLNFISCRLYRGSNFFVFHKLNIKAFQREMLTVKCSVANLVGL